MLQRLARTRILPYLFVLFLVALSAAPEGLFGSPASSPPVFAQDGLTPPTLFDLTVSLEWQPDQNPQWELDLGYQGCNVTLEGEATGGYLEMLGKSLQRASNYLYRSTNGQFAFGTVKVYTNGEHWDDADIRILADSTYRPSAIPGGIVKTPQVYENPATGSTLTFVPGDITLGRLWNGKSGNCGYWQSANGWRTIVHEWSHYSFFLFDEYIENADQSEQYCTNTADQATGFDILAIPKNDPKVGETSSLMAYQYAADRFWQSQGQVAPKCQGTPQMLVHGGDDWTTINKFYPQATPPDPLASLPSFSIGPKITLTVTAASMPSDSAAFVEGGTALGPTHLGESFLLKLGPAGFAPPQRIIGQGDIAGQAKVVFLGVQPPSRAVVVARDWQKSGKHMAFPANYNAVTPVGLSGINTATAVTSTWQPSITIIPDLTPNPQTGVPEFSGLRVAVEDCATTLPKRQIEIIHCPAGGDCGIPVTKEIFNTAVSHTFMLTDAKALSRHGYVYVRSLLTQEETIIPYITDGGIGPPGNKNTPRVDGEVSVNAVSSQTIAPGSLVLHHSAQRCTRSQYQLDNTVRRLVSIPVQLAVTQPGRGGIANQRLLVRLSYDQGVLRRLGVRENRLVLLRLVRNRWQRVEPVNQSTALGWIATARPLSLNPNGEIFAFGELKPLR